MVAVIEEFYCITFRKFMHNATPISDPTESGEQGLVLAIDIEGTY